MHRDDLPGHDKENTQPVKSYAGLILLKSVCPLGCGVGRHAHQEAQQQHHTDGPGPRIRRMRYDRLHVLGHLVVKVVRDPL